MELGKASSVFALPPSEASSGIPSGYRGLLSCVAGSGGRGSFPDPPSSRRYQLALRHCRRPWLGEQTVMDLAGGVGRYAWLTVCMACRASHGGGCLHAIQRTLA
jgi:hypothetical protein